MMFDGDRWKSKGDNGVWHRWHVTPRLSLFTPYRVAKGPAPGTSLQPHRFTCGVTQSGRSFEFHDDWTKESNHHRHLEEPWVGFTVFSERSGDNVKVLEQCDGHSATMQRGFQGRWADA